MTRQMTPLEREVMAALALLTGCGSLLGQPADLEQAGEAWNMLFRDLPAGALTAAVVAHLNDPERAHRWPTPADIRGRVEQIRAAARGEQTALTADELWPLVIASLQGTYDLDAWEDGVRAYIPPQVRFTRVLAYRLAGSRPPQAAEKELAQRVLETIGGASGYRALCIADTDALVAERAAFRKAWEAGVKRERDAQVLRPIFGQPRTAGQLGRGGR